MVDGVGKRKTRCEGAQYFQLQTPPKEGDAKMNVELERVRKMTISAIFEKLFNSHLNSDFNSRSYFHENRTEDRIKNGSKLATVSNPIGQGEIRQCIL